MASRPYKEQLGAYGVSKFAEGFLQGQQRRQELERMAAERLLKQQQDTRDADLAQRKFKLEVLNAKEGSTVIGTNGKQYHSPGLSDEDAQSILPGRRGKQVPPGAFEAPAAKAKNPSVVEVASGKVTVQKSQPPSLILSPDDARGMSGKTTPNHVVIAPAPKAAGLTPDKRFALDTAKQLMHEYVTNGSLSAHQADLLADASKHLDINVVPEEDQGVLAFISKMTGNTQYVPQVKSSAAPAQVKMIRVRHKASGQTGSVPENEFNPSLYEKI
jgi:hypothetical protein